MHAGNCDFIMSRRMIGLSEGTVNGYIHIYINYKKTIHFIFIYELTLQKLSFIAAWKQNHSGKLY